MYTQEIEKKIHVPFLLHNKRAPFDGGAPYSEVICVLIPKSGRGTVNNYTDPAQLLEIKNRLPCSG